MEIYCRNINRYLPLQGGETLAEILAHTPELAEMAQKERPICARVNNKTEPLQFQVFGPKMVEYLPRTSGSGERVYIRSLCMMLYCALRRERPGMRLRIEHSISGGYYCRLSDADGKSVIPDRALVEDLRRRMRAQHAWPTSWLASAWPMTACASRPLRATQSPTSSPPPRP